MSILATTLPAAGTVPVELPPLTYPHIVASPGAGALSLAAGPMPTGPQFLADHAATPLNTVIQQPDGKQPLEDSSGATLGPTTPTAPPNTTTWLTNFSDQVILTEPF